MNLNLNHHQKASKEESNYHPWFLLDPYTYTILYVEIREIGPASRSGRCVEIA